MDAQQLKLGHTIWKDILHKSNLALGKRYNKTEFNDWRRWLPLTKKANIPNDELETQIAENIFDWWISGKPYAQWYSDKFLQGRIDFNED